MRHTALVPAKCGGEAPTGCAPPLKNPVLSEEERKLRHSTKSLYKLLPIKEDHTDEKITIPRSAVNGDGCTGSARTNHLEDFSSPSMALLDR